VVEAYDAILHRGVDGQTYNIGSQVERSVLSVAHDVLRIMRLPADKVKHVRDRAFNDRRYFVCDKKLAKLGGSPVTGSHYMAEGPIACSIREYPRIAASHISLHRSRDFMSAGISPHGL